ncbi:MAG: sigma-70 family RNA polymerase sigma factor [Phycisphaerae bacterium]|nr:RNA polymerase sigma factor [Phycisphaerae bacterium]NUQ47259.1 sigma-70 family RNA polymerase sigma factor [Phycisphaerae bacterium]
MTEPASFDDRADRTEPLIQGAMAGDEDSIRRLLILYHPRLRARLVRQMDATLRGRLEPEDILQQVYFEAFRALPSFRYRGPNSFLRWLFTILDRKLIDEHRAVHADRRDVRREIHSAAQVSGATTYIDLLSRLKATSVTASQVVRREEALGVVTACLASLPEHYRQVLQMRFLQGMAVADVAESLGRSVGSIHMICHRALQQLRELVEQYGINAEAP